jgi:hypothetical protein
MLHPFQQSREIRMTTGKLPMADKGNKKKKQGQHRHQEDERNENVERGKIVDRGALVERGGAAQSRIYMTRTA